MRAFFIFGGTVFVSATGADCPPLSIGPWTDGGLNGQPRGYFSMKE